MRLYRQRQRFHPYRNTPQYKQMRDRWPEYVGGRWVEPEVPDDDEFPVGRFGSWDRYLRRTHQQYATGY